MSKPAPIYRGSSRPCSPACALLDAPRCLAASPVSPPVHGVSTTRATTPDPGDQHQPAGRDSDPASQDLSLRHLEYEISAYGCALPLVRPVANVHAVSGALPNLGAGLVPVFPGRASRASTEHPVTGLARPFQS